MFDFRLMKREMVTTQPGQVTIATSSSCFFPPRRPPFLIADAAKLRQSVKYILLGTLSDSIFATFWILKCWRLYLAVFTVFAKSNNNYGFLFLSSHDDHIHLLTALKVSWVSLFCVTQYLGLVVMEKLQWALPAQEFLSPLLAMSVVEGIEYLVYLEYLVDTSTAELVFPAGGR